jgi:hypothetical protein
MGKEYRDRDDVYEEEGDWESLEVSDDDDKDEADVEEVPTEVSLSAAWRRRGPPAAREGGSLITPNNPLGCSVLLPTTTVLQFNLQGRQS